MRTVALLVMRRVLLGALTMLAVSVVIFSAVGLLPGDTAEALLGQSATPEAIATLRQEMRLDRPAPVRYLSWVGDLIRGDAGNSLASGRPVTHLLRERLPNTLFLAALAAIVSVPLSICLGVICALYRDSLLDRALNVVTLGIGSLPDFFTAYLLVIIFATQLAIFPALSDISSVMPFLGKLNNSVLPAATLILSTLAYMMRMTRASIVGVLASSYIKMATLKGLSPGRIIWRHALRNAIAPIANIVALSLAYLVAGVVVVETVFVYPGLGQLLVDSVSKRDVPVIQIISLIFAGLYVTLNLTADVVSLVSNPRLLHA